VTDRTALTEIVTGLGMLGGDLRGQLPARPGELRNVDDGTWEALVDGWDDPDLVGLADRAFANGRSFYDALDGLRGRRPRQVEWTGRQRSPGDEVAPIDLRVDHVYLISCKYLSKITMNASPAHVFERLLTGGHGRRSGDWYRTVAPTEHGALWRATCHHLALADMDLDALDHPARKSIAHQLRGAWPASLAPSYESLCAAVSQRSAQRWSEALAAQGARAAESMLWRLLRIGSAPYFVLGSSDVDALRLRVASPWDWRQRYRFDGLRVEAAEGGQPMVRWTAAYREGTRRAEVAGHVEIRWSHGRFSGPPEAKVYLDTPFAEVPGYWPLA